MKHAVFLIVFILFFSAAFAEKPVCDATTYLTNLERVWPMHVDFEDNEAVITQGNVNAVIESSPLAVNGKNHLKVTFTGTGSVEFSDIDNYADVDYLEFSLTIPESGPAIFPKVSVGEEIPVVYYIVGQPKIGLNLVRIPVSDLSGPLVISTNASYTEPLYTYYIDAINYVAYRDSPLKREFCQQLTGGQFSYVETIDVSAEMCSWYDHSRMIGTQCCGATASSFIGDQLCLKGQTISQGLFGQHKYTINGQPFWAFCYSQNCVVPFPSSNLPRPYEIEGATFADGTTTSTTAQGISIQIARPQYYFSDQLYSCGEGTVFGVDPQVITPSETDGEACVQTDSFYCADNYFFTSNADLVVKRSEDGSTFSCCEQSQCFDDGEYSCYDDQLGNSNEPLVEDSFCIAGIWRNDPPASRFDGATSGYCPQASDCYLSQTLDGDVICAQHQSYFSSYYCDNGKWRSRISLLANALEQFAAQNQYSDTYTLTCGVASNLFNYYGLHQGTDVRLLLDNIEVSDGIEFQNCDLETNVDDRCKMKACILDAENRDPIFGLALDEPLQDSFLSQLFSLSCSSGEGFVSCSNPTWHYNEELQLLLFERERSVFSLAPLIDAFKDAFSFLYDSDFTILPVQSDVYEQLYKNTYLEKPIIGYSEYQYVDGRYQDTFVINYGSVSSDFCGDILSTQQADCREINQDIVVVGQGSLWQQLTTQLRLN